MKVFGMPLRTCLGNDIFQSYKIGMKSSNLMLLNGKLKLF